METLAAFSSSAEAHEDLEASLQSTFRAAANSVAQLYTQAIQNNKRAYAQGFVACLNELEAFVAQQIQLSSSSGAMAPGSPKKRSGSLMGRSISVEHIASFIAHHRAGFDRGGSHRASQTQLQQQQQQQRHHQSQTPPAIPSSSNATGQLSESLARQQQQQQQHQHQMQEQDQQQKNERQQQQQQQQQIQVQVHEQVQQQQQEIQRQHELQIQQHQQQPPPLPNLGAAVDDNIMTPLSSAANGVVGVQSGMALELSHKRRHSSHAEQIIRYQQQHSMELQEHMQQRHQQEIQIQQHQQHQQEQQQQQQQHQLGHIQQHQPGLNQPSLFSSAGIYDNNHSHSNINFVAGPFGSHPFAGGMTMTGDAFVGYPFGIEPAFKRGRYERM